MYRYYLVWSALFALPALSVLHESLSRLPRGWTSSKLIVDPEQEVQFSIALAFQNLHLLESKLREVSDLESEKYGQYLDRDDVRALFGHSKPSEARVVSWLKESKAAKIEVVDDTVNFVATVANANKMMQTSFRHYTNGHTTQLRTLMYSVPQELSEDIDFITPTIQFGASKGEQVRKVMRKRAIDPNPAQYNRSCEGEFHEQYIKQPLKYIKLPCLKRLYNLTGYTVDPKSGSSLAFVTLGDNAAEYSDLQSYEEFFGLSKQNFSVVLVNGAVNNQSFAARGHNEPDLDVEALVALSDGLPITEFIVGTEHPGSFLQFIQYVMKQPNSALPYVFSVSYADEEQSLSSKYVARVCNMFAMVGMRGRTFLAASGDSGPGDICRSQTAPHHPIFETLFPSTCPYVTSVGGTDGIVPVVAEPGSGGGFSFYFPRPWYQQKAVETYLTKYINHAAKARFASNEYTNFSNRGYPDVSAHYGDPGFFILEYGNKMESGGTSLATPIVASIIAQLNDARLRAGQPAMGFINPWLYSVEGKSAFRDITAGRSTGCFGFPGFPHYKDIPGAGFNATPGWDPVTGLGTPDFAVMKTLTLECKNNC